MSWYANPAGTDGLAYFTVRARKALQLAVQESQRLGCDLIGTEHLLLGLAKEGGGVAARVFRSLRFDLRRARVAVEKTAMPRDEDPRPGRLEFNGDASGIIWQAIEQANRLAHTRVSTGHLLLALLAHSECRGQQVIRASALMPEMVRRKVLVCFDKVEWERLEDMPVDDKQRPESAEFKDARELVLKEGLGEEGIVAAVRMGNIPSSDRMSPLLASLEVVYRDLHGRGVIDRELANALHGLTFHIQGDINGMLDRGIAVSDRFISDELTRMFLMVESILEDKWMLD